MTWSVLINNKPVVRDPPTPEQVAAATAAYDAPPPPPPPPPVNPNPRPYIMSDAFMARLSGDQVKAITDEAIAELAAGATQFSQWWLKVSAGKGFVQLDQANVVAIKALLVANGVLTQDAADAAFAPPAPPAPPA